MDNNFNDFLLQCGHNEVIRLINKMASLSVSLTNEKTVDGCIEYLDAYYCNQDDYMSYPYAVITDNFGANVLLKSLIELELIKEKIKTSTVTDELVNEYMKMNNIIDSYKSILIEYENDISNKKTR